MDIKVTEPLYVRNGGVEHVVRPGTTGTEKNKVVYFYDATRTIAVGFAKDFCLENPQVFQVSRTLTDKEVSLRDVLRIVETTGFPNDTVAEIYEKLKQL